MSRPLDASALDRLATAARDAASPHEAIARYEIRRELGRGASGVVYEALDTELGRPVALKVLSRTAELSPDARARFLRESRAAARLSHPSIAAVYDANESFIAMQLVPGADLAARPIREAKTIAGLVRDAALAVHYAHGQGVVHRDLKPANLIATTDEPLRLVVTDFGLATGADAEARLSRSGSIVGTPSYMAPEQARGALGAVDARADVYGLGATLYDQIAGRPPFVAESVVELLRRVTDEEAPPLVAATPHVDRDLSTIVSKCLEKSPERRYPSALALAGDLDRWLRGEAILARAPSTVYRLRRFVARRQGAFVAALAAAFLVLAVVVPFWLQARARRETVERALVLADTVSRALDRARTLRAASRPAEATEVLDRATSAAVAFVADADVARASLALGRLLAAQYRPADAIRAFDRALELDPSLDEARFERGVARGVLVREGTAVGDGEQPPAEVEALRVAAIADLEAARSGGRDDDPSSEDLWGAALRAFLEGRWDEARRLGEDVVTLDPAHVEALLVLSRVAARQGDLDHAMFRSAQALDLMSGLGQAYRAPGAAAASGFTWTRLPGRRELILDLRKAASARPNATFANGALAQEGLEAGSRALAAGDGATALRAVDEAMTHLTRALQAAGSDAAIVAARGVASLLRDEALMLLARGPEAADERAAAARDLDAAGRDASREVRAAALWNESLLAERRSRLALVSGDAATAAAARDEAQSARERARSLATPGGDLHALLADEGAPANR